MSNYCYEFEFNGTSSKEFDLLLYESIGNISKSDSLIASVMSTVEDRIARSLEPIVYGSKNGDPQSIPMIIGVSPERINNRQYIDNWELGKIAQWLTGHQDYKRLDILNPNLDDAFFKCKITAFKPISVGGDVWGFSATATCDSGFANTHTQHFKYDVNGSLSAKILNRGNYNGEYYPKITLSLPSGGDFSIVNQSDNDREFSFSDMPTSSLNISMDNQWKTIVEDEGVNLYSNFNWKFFRLVPGDNYLAFTGVGNIDIICEFPIVAYY